MTRSTIGTGAGLLRVYTRLRGRFGHAGWWPGETPFEVCVGAILTQNTSWTNVEKALRALESHGALTYEGMSGLSERRLATLIRSSGYFNLKARRLRDFLAFLASEYGGQVERMAGEDPRALRSKLLEVRGVGPETADSIVLYAAGLPLFVVDAYTRRAFTRLGMLRGGESYSAIQEKLMRLLPADVALYNDYHAQIVNLGKDLCRPRRPRCGECPLDDVCPKRGL